MPQKRKAARASAENGKRNEEGTVAKKPRVDKNGVIFAADKEASISNLC